MSETNLQLFPGVFRSTQGGANPDFFLHSAGRVGIGNDAPEDKPTWSSNDNDRNKLNVTGHTHITGSLNVTGHLYGDGSNLSGVAAVIGGYWDLDESNNNIKYEAGNVGIGGAASPGHTLDVTGDINFSGNIRKNGAIQTFGGGTPTSYEYTSGGTTTKFRTGSTGSLGQNNGRNIGESGGMVFSIWETNAGSEGSWIAIGGDYITMCSPTDSSYSIVYYDEDNGVGGPKKWHITNTGSLVGTSDSRLKHEIKPLIWENVLEKIGNLEPSTFKFKCPESCDRVTKKWDIEHIGFIAQNVQANFPELICEDGSSENYLMVNLTMMILPIIQGTQQLTTDLQTTKEELQAEKEKVASLEERLAALEAIVLNQ